jgi:hypothetical protein
MSKGIYPRIARQRITCVECGVSCVRTANNVIRCGSIICERARGRRYRRGLWAKDREGVTANIKQWRDRSPQKILLISARQRAKRAGIKFSITCSDIPMPEKCPVLGIHLERGSRKSSDNSPSIDRINPSLGYVPGNVRIICHRANRLKSDASIEEVRKILTYIEENTKEKKKTA